MAISTLPSLSFFFPAYNEQLNLPKLIEQADRVASKVAKRYELIVINDGSTDKTIETVTQLIKKYPHLRIVSHAENQGYGAALKTGLHESRYEWIFFTDADLQFDMAELKKFIPYTENFDIIIGWRTTRADGAKRAFNARLFKLYIDLLYRLHVRDIDCAFKLLKSQAVKKIRLDSSSAFTTTELLYKLKKRDVPFKELPVSHYPRSHGNPTGANIRVIIKACREALFLYLKIKLGSLSH